jgi:putative sugar O-methyltransferase
MSLEPSNLWKALCADQFAKVDESFLVNFRRPGGANSRLAWEPADNTMRYFKFLLYAAAERQSERFFQLYRALDKVDIGQPVTVTLRGCQINIDYFLALDEFLFLESAIDLPSLRSIVEIGAGFGRTCHTLVALTAAEIKQYTIVDLPQILELSRRALAKLVPAHYRKIRFIDARNEHEWDKLRADLVINIDSFQEMLPHTIDSYMRRIVSRCGAFYGKNPIAKYDPSSVGLVADPVALQDVFSLGYCRDTIDIFNDEALKAARPSYIEAYRPASNWKVIAERPMALFPYYHHVLYRRLTPAE